MGSPSGLEKVVDRAEPWAARLDHDVRHELATIAMLAAACCTDPSLTLDTRRRMWRIEEEVRQVALLIGHGLGLEPVARVTGVRVVVEELAAAIRLVATTSLEVVGAEHHVLADPVDLRRAVRNLIDNAVRAAGPLGRVVVGVTQDGPWAVLTVDDDGAGYPPAAPVPDLRTRRCLGLEVVREFTARCGGQFAIFPSNLGGTRAAIRLRRPKESGASGTLP